MSNTLAKEEVLFEAITTTFANDNVDTGETVRELHFYIEDRVSRENKRIDEDNPQVTMELEHGPDHDGIPSGIYFLELKTYVGMDDAYPQTKLGRIESRMLTLINKQPAVLNLAVASKNLRCRYIVKTLSTPTVDQIARLHVKITRFRVVLDDENID